MHDETALNDFSGVSRLFPLPGVVLFPHSVLPLHIFEPRYRQMTTHALAGDRLITIVQLKSNSDWSNLEEPPIESVGCVGKIIDHEKLQDGRFNMLLLGCKRARIVREIGGDTLYRQAEAVLLEDDPPGPESETALREFVKLAFERSELSRKPHEHEFEEVLSSSAPVGVLLDLISHALDLPSSLKQSLLAEPRVGLRTMMLFEYLSQKDPELGRFGRRLLPFPPTFSSN